MKLFFTSNLFNVLLLLHCSLFTVHYSLFTVHYSLFTVHYSLPPVHYSLSQNYFRSPLDIPLKLAANFGDIRPNHYHAGIDIETEQREGLKVYAVADGYVSRIKVAPNGYGNAIYINHPNGYTSVYGHLQRYDNKIAEYVKKNQYQLESFQVDLFPDSALFIVKKGDVIAYSGNTGDSGGPHVHFEIRDTKSEEPVDPLLFGFDIPDHKAPVFNALKVYPVNHSGVINGKAIQQRYSIINKYSNSYQLLENSVINVQGTIGFAVEGYDMEDGNEEHFTIYSLELIMDGKTQFNATIDRFNFNETRCVNAHIDYEELKKSNEQFLKLFKDPNDKFNAYKARTNGVLTINDTLLHHIKIIAKDAYENTSELNFKVKSNHDSKAPIATMKPANIENIIPYQYPDSFQTNDIKIFFPEGTLYDTLFMTYSSTKESPNYYSFIHHIHNIYTPINSNINLSIKCHNLPKNIESKALLVHLDSKGNASAVKSSFKDGYVVGNPNVLGDFAVMIDTIAPTIIRLNKANGMYPIQFKITDNLSGIKSVRATLNGHWILMKEDAKTQTFTLDSDKPFQTNTNNGFHLEVVDNKGNKATYTQ
jgi:hypothetical protein